MVKNLSSAELDAEHVELLPARTLVTTLLIPVQSGGAGVAVVDAPDSDGADSTGPPSPPCKDIPWWAPKPPDC
jgi:hypothetical protein